MEPRRSARIRGKAEAATDTPATAKPPPDQIRQAKKVYARRQQNVVEKVKKQIGDQHAYIAQLSEEAEKNKAELETYRRELESMRSKERGDYGSDSEAMSIWDSDAEANAKTEPQEEEGLFVSQEKTSLLVATDNDDDDDDEATLFKGEEILGHVGDYGSDTDNRYHGFLCAGLNRWYRVIGRGPLSAEKLELVPSPKVTRKEMGSDKDLKYNRKNLREENGDKIRVDGVKVQVDIQGVTWISSQCPEDPIDLMNPERWEKIKSSGDHKSEKRAKTFPFTSIRLKWVTIDDNGKRTVEKTFETRSTVRSIYGKQPKAAPRDYKIGDRVVLKEGTVLPAADFAIFAAAIISWDRHEKWKKDPSMGKDRSPTPDEALQTTTTRRGPKKAAR
ncbi:hypothetical protein LY76DRAFT_417762 [Colletotrichum caudatum]|nr:hypothetical protein LY76DRAFT_417762 [Colletotrichum caudatum]